MSEIAKKTSSGSKDRALSDGSVPEQETTDSLRLLSSDASLINALVKQGYSSIAAIATASYNTFSQAISGVASPQKIERLYSSAQAQYSVMNTMTAGLLADLASYKHRQKLTYTDGLPTYQAEPCNSSIGPNAYLDALLAFAEKNLLNNNPPITREWLAATFCQPFNGLVMDCSASETQIHQVRVCIEVLRAYLKSILIPDAYLEQSYQDLLISNGTSYRELQQSLRLPVDNQARLELAKRLGIKPDNLKELFLPTITEPALAELFGLASTQVGQISPDEPGLLTWRKQYLHSLWLQADYPESPARYREPVVDPDLIQEANLRQPLANNPAYTLWLARKDEIARQDAHLQALREGEPDQSGFEKVVEYVLQVPVSTLLDLATGRSEGKDINPDLENLALLESEFNYLILIARIFSDSGSTLLDDEWLAIDAMLVQNWKRRHFADWRVDEEQSAISLSPEFFQIAKPDPLIFPPPASYEPPEWRGTLEARVDWLAILQARIEQEEQVVRALKASVTSCESANLPGLRNELILQIPNSVIPDSDGSFDAKSAWFTNNFQIDASLIGTQLTTRVGQAIETLQGILWAVRIDDLAETHPDLSLVDQVDFDEAWSWIGAFASWRASQMEEYYPENFMQPGLRSHQTSAFQDLVAATRSYPGFTPQKAREIAVSYTTYLQNVSTLTLGAACLGSTRMNSDGSLHDLYYMFARGTNMSRALYWSSFDLSVSLSPSGYEQSSWSPVPEMTNTVDIIGVQPYDVNSALRLLLLFAIISLNGTRKLVVTRYNLETHIWDSSPTVIETPEQSSSFTAIIEQHFSGSKIPPTLVARLDENSLYRGVLAGDGTMLNQQGWTKWQPGSAADGNMAILACIRFSDTDWRLVLRMSNGLIGAMSQLNNWVGGQVPGFYLGTLNFRSDSVFLIYRDTSTIVRYYHIDRAVEWKKEFPAPASTERIAINGGFSSTEVIHACWSSIEIKEQRVYRSSHTALRFADDAISIDSLLPAAPVLSGPFQITDLLNELELERRALEIDKAFEDNAGAPLSILNYLDEAYYFVPLQLMDQLQLSGQYIIALDWLRTVYNYTQPASKALVYAGLRSDIQAGIRRQSLMDLLQDPLDAHRIMLTRRDSLIKFALQMGIRCFLAYADAEFSRDTTESVPRARTLYISASRLLERYKNLPIDGDLVQRLSEKREDLRHAGGDGLHQTELQHAMLLAQPAIADEVRNIGQSAPLTGKRRLLLTNLFHIVPDFEVPPNPVIQGLYLHMAVNLYKIRSGCNIAGMVRLFDPYAVSENVGSGYPIIGEPGEQLPLPGTRAAAPTLYRYTVLIERARQEVALATQVENAMLAALEKRDAEYYTLLRARQDLGLAQANVQLQDLRVQEGQSSVVLAQLGQQRAQTQASYYQARLDEGISPLETSSLAFMNSSVALQLSSAGMNFLAAALPASVSAGFPSGVSISTSPQGAVQSIASGFSSLAGAAETTGSILSTIASYERRRQEWEFQKNVAARDVLIEAQQVTIAQDHVRVIGQDRNIAALQSSNASTNVEYLANKFTNTTLYDWMSQVLEEVYRSLLQRTTSLAQLAAAQLAFERQETPPAIIKTDYWEMTSGGGTEQDRKGLTGSYRLLEDINSLDAYAFASAKRKLQLTKTVSLARLAPAEFQNLKSSGLLQFATPMELFDRDFPGHYLRLINRVRVSVIALIPTTESIKATLSTSGISRVVVGSNDQFHSLVINRQPEQVALTSPRDASGVFELHAIQSEMLLPFENTGVDTTWTLSIPRAANLFDYDTIADVLLTMEYTALYNESYRTQVCRSLGTTSSAERPFSFRQELLDQWYDLNNPDLTKPTITVSFRTRLTDFPPNMRDLHISQVALYFRLASGYQFDDEKPFQCTLFLTVDGKQEGGSATPSTDGIISTRRGNASEWTPLIDLVPSGTWELSLPNTPEMRQLFSEGVIEDLLFDISYTYHTPDWIF